jgi:hypothetical protein
MSKLHGGGRWLIVADDSGGSWQLMTIGGRGFRARTAGKGGPRPIGQNVCKSRASAKKVFGISAAQIICARFCVEFPVKTLVGNFEIPKSTAAQTICLLWGGSQK